MRKLFVGSQNPHKISEIKAFLGALNIQVIAEQMPDVDETGGSFEDNAILKARAAAAYSGLPSIGDDSGICVWGLNGRPGIFSKRWAGPENNYQHAFEKIESELTHLRMYDRSASFFCCIACAYPHEDQAVTVFEGRVDGEIVTPSRGKSSFGYDPIFIPKGHHKTFAEMSPEEKAAISARSMALRELVAYLGS